jgi:hypothetical protein
MQDDLWAKKPPFAFDRARALFQFSTTLSERSICFHDELVKKAGWTPEKKRLN